ncbi:MAG: hypothetical protein RBS16_09435 [Candidatus Cloacimonadales bacterium]|jgi:hypothetical protein|nr:hypothetical protein [Candidatus Cloacimonadota bacterium]MDD3502415.1 hypothetical protein [Candidatus Cloacimonadota bacterium]MDX9978234.1 hypothetical protein [Candidatus Cloacimonadales bacterium]
MDNIIDLINSIILPGVLGIIGYVWVDVTTRVKSIEERLIRMEKDIVRISTMFTSQK